MIGLLIAALAVFMSWALYIIAYFFFDDVGFDPPTWPLFFLPFISIILFALAFFLGLRGML